MMACAHILTKNNYWTILIIISIVFFPTAASIESTANPGKDAAESISSQSDIDNEGNVDPVHAELEKLSSAGYLFFPHVYRAFIDAGKRPDDYGLEGECKENLKVFYKALNAREGWAWSMYDSTGKQGPGLFTGAFTWTGNDQQCLNTLGYKATVSNTFQNSNPGIDAQYCSVTINTPFWAEQVIDSFNLPYTVPKPPFVCEVCLVKGCSEKDIFNIVQKFVNIGAWNGNFSVSSVHCLTSIDISEDPAAIITLVVFGLIILTVVVGTFYDIYLRSKRSGIRSSYDIPIGAQSMTDGRYEYFMAAKNNGIEGPAIHGYVYENDAFDNDEEVEGGKSLSISQSDGFLGIGTLEAQKDGHNAPIKTSPEITPGSNSISTLLSSMNQAEMKMSDLNSTNDESANHQNRFSDHDASDKSDLQKDGGGITTGDGMISTISYPESDPPKLIHQPFTNYIKHGGKSAMMTKISHLKLQKPEENVPQIWEQLRHNVPQEPSREYDIHPSSSFPRLEKKHLKTRLSVIAIRSPIPTTSQLLKKILVNFSFRRNMGNIMGRGHGDVMFCLNGIRALSINWIVLMTFLSIVYNKPTLVSNHVDTVKLTQSFWMQAMINSTFAADTFFVMSGCLYAYNFTKLKKKSKEKRFTKVMTFLEYAQAVVHRLFRIYPCYIIAIMLYTNLGRYIRVGVSEKFSTERNARCQEHWWANALFISNFYKPDQMCMPWTYYLVNDFQFSLLAPLAMIPMICMPALGFCILVLLIGIHILSVMVVNTGINGNVMKLGDTDYWSKVYVKPYCRVGAYAVGLGVGYLVFIGRQQTRFRQVPLYVGWVLSLSMFAILPYITYLENQEGGTPWSGVETSLYEALSRPAWSLAVGWIIYTCSNGQGGFVSKILNWNLFVPMCRTTYGVYLLHPIILDAIMNAKHNAFFVTFFEVIQSYVANIICCWLAALIFIITVEQSFTSIEVAVRKHLQSRKDI